MLPANEKAAYRTLIDRFREQIDKRLPGAAGYGYSVAQIPHSDLDHIGRDLIALGEMERLYAELPDEQPAAGDGEQPCGVVGCEPYE